VKYKPYHKLAQIYNRVMKNVDYINWAKYILDIAEDYINSESSILELAAGNCKMAEIISDKYPEYIATDLNLPMLKSFEKKIVTRICCDMSELPFNKKNDFIFSAFDSVNYILTQKKLIKFFREVCFVLSNNGIFTFDVSLEKNSTKYDIPNMVEDHHNGFHYQRINRYNKRNQIHYNTFILTDNDGRNTKEVHKQKIYDIMTYFKLAEKAGLHIVACYDCFTFNDLKADSERAQFVMRKVK